MRKAVLAIFGTAVATLVSAGVLPPNSESLELIARADPNSQYGCYCREATHGGFIPLQNVTEKCCPTPLRKNDNELCMPLDEGPVLNFLKCCVRVGGGHGFGGDCRDTKDIEAGHGDFPPKVTDSFIHATPTPTPDGEAITKRDLLTTDGGADDDKQWCECFPKNNTWTNTCCNQAKGNPGLFNNSWCQLGSDGGIADFRLCCQSAGSGHPPGEFYGSCHTGVPLDPLASARPTLRTATAIVTVIVTETSNNAVPTQTDIAALVGPRQNADDEKHYCWCYPNNKDVTAQCCTEIDGLFYREKLCVVPSRDKESAFDMCCREIGDHGAADYGPCMDVDPDDHHRHPFTTIVTLGAKREEVTETPVHKTHTSPYYITHHPVTL